MNRPTRPLSAALIGALVSMFALTVFPVSSAAAASDKGPRLTEPKPKLAAAFKCTGNVGKTGRKPAVLLVHGTGTTSSETWSWNLRPRLGERGYPVCTVDIPERSWTDLQDNVEYVVHAIRAAHRKSDAKIAVIGHSQGAFLPSYALRVWPDLARKVRDFVGYAGTYTYGTDAFRAPCTGPCAPAAHQFHPGSNLLTEIAKHPLPQGPSYTAFSTQYDGLVLPQPSASTLGAPGVRNYILQDLCPTNVANHVTILAEMAFFQLTFDALAHRGPGRIDRVSEPACGPAPESATGVTVLPTYALGFLVEYATRLTPEEPPLRDYWSRL